MRAQDAADSACAGGGDGLGLLRLGSLERSLFSRIGGISQELVGAGTLCQRLLLGILGLLGLNLLLLAVLS